MDEEETIKRITRLLEMGGTMLATHHDCGAPLFRYKGDIVCPVCSFDLDKGKAVDRPESPLSPKSDKPKASEGAKISEKSKKSEVEKLSSDTSLENRTRFGSEPENEMISSDKTPEYPKVDQMKKELQKAILSKLQEISDKMGEEQDPNRIKNQLECINEALKVLKSLKR